jgi:hypothetical protein
MNLFSLLEISYRWNIHTLFEYLQTGVKEDHIAQGRLNCDDFFCLTQALRGQVEFMENYIKMDMYDLHTMQGIIDILDSALDQTQEIGEDSFKYFINESKYETSIKEIKELENKRNIVKEEFIRIIATIIK